MIKMLSAALFFAFLSTNIYADLANAYPEYPYPGLWEYNQPAYAPYPLYSPYSYPLYPTYGGFPFVDQSQSDYEINAIYHENQHW